MKILALSDIHDRLSAVSELLRRERGHFDAIIVAGDMGSSARTILEMLTTLGCPVAFVQGNWDNGEAMIGGLPPSCFHVHLRALQIGPWCVVGMDFPSWERPEDYRPVRARLAAIVQEAGPENCIVVTHDRLTRTGADMAGVPIFLFGHKHKFSCTKYKESTYLNVSALGEFRTVRRDREVVHHRNYRNAIKATYVRISLHGTNKIDVERRGFAHELTGWTPLKGEKWPGSPELGAPFVSQDTEA